MLTVVSGKWGFVVAVLGMLGGCALSERPSLSSVADNEPTEVSLDAQEIREFNQNKARLDKLASMEADLSLLLTELSKHTNIGESPGAYRRQPKEELVEASFSVADDQEQEQDNVSVTTYTAVLGRYFSRQGAESAARQLGDTFHISSFNMSLDIGVEDSSSATFAVVLGTFRSQQLVTLLCDAFARHNQFCSPGTNDFVRSPAIKQG